jgi:outer membrane protein insertion porin family
MQTPAQDLARRPHAGPALRARNAANTTLVIWLFALALHLAATPFIGTARAGVDYQGVKIVEIQFEGLQTIPREKVLRHIQSKEGRAYDNSTIDGDLKRLEATRMFEKVRVFKKEDKARGGVIIIFHFTRENPELTEVKFIGAKAIKIKDLEEKTGLKKGSRADPIIVMMAKESIARLYEEKGYWYAEVKIIEGANYTDRRAVFEIFEGKKCAISSVSFEGNEFVPSSTLMTKITSKRKWLGLWPGKYDPEDIESDVHKLREYYESLGYFAAKVAVVKRMGSGPSDAKLTFAISEGTQFKVRNIRFDGNQLIATDALMKGMIMHSGRPFNQTFQEADAKFLNTKYGEIGCIDAQVAPQVIYTDKSDVVDLVYHVEEGEPYLLGEFIVKGNARTRDEVLRREAERSGLVPGEPLNRTYLEAYRKRVNQLGYFQTNPQLGKPVEIKLVNKRPNAQRYPTSDAPLIEAGSQVIPARLQDPGPQAAPDVPVIIPPPNLAPALPPAGPGPGDGFGSGRILDPPPEMTPIPVPRLRGAPGGVVPQDPPPGTRTPPVGNGEVPGFPSLPGGNMNGPPTERNEPFRERSFVDMITAVDEASTGRIGLMVGVSSYQGLIGNFVIHERNFDLFNWPRTWDELFSGQAFRGRGQDLSISLSPGTVYSSSVVSFTDPYAFGLPIGFNIQGYVSNRIWPSWTEGRAGGKISIGRQFGPMIYADVAARLENVDFHGFKIPAPADYLAAAGHTTLGTIRTSLRVDNRNDVFSPNRGSFVETAFEQGWGNFTFPKFTIEGRQYITTGSRPDQTGKRFITLRGYFGITGRDTPVYERFFAGNFRSLRGFGVRGVGPYELGVNVGGIMEALGSVEYQFPLTASDKLQQVVFCDFGTVEPNYTFTTFRASVGTGLRIYLPQQFFGNLPLCFDFAVPVAKGPNDHLAILAFFMGTMF